MDDAEVARCAPLPRSGSPFALAALEDALVCESGDEGSVGRVSPVSTLTLKLEPMRPRKQAPPVAVRRPLPRAERAALPPITPRAVDDPRSPRPPAAARRVTPLAVATPSPARSFFEEDDAVARVTPSPRPGALRFDGDAGDAPRRRPRSAASTRVTVPPLAAPPVDAPLDFDQSPRPSGRKSFSPRGPGRRAGEMRRSNSLAAISPP